jgi:hypothetical protein
MGLLLPVFKWLTAWFTRKRRAPYIISADSPKPGTVTIVYGGSTVGMSKQATMSLDKARERYIEMTRIYFTTSRNSLTFHDLRKVTHAIRKASIDEK